MSFISFLDNTLYILFQCGISRPLKKTYVLTSDNDFSELRTWITKISRGIDYESIHEYLLGRASFAEHT